MTEREFTNTIDCQFPYLDETKWREVIKLGSQISSNAAFAILGGICRPPLGVEVSSSQLEHILEYWKVEFRYLLAEPLGKVASSMMKRKRISSEEAVNLLNLVADHRHLYGALNTPYFACDDTDGFVDKMYSKTIQNWKDVEHR